MPRDCPVCGIEYDRKEITEGGRDTTVETDGERRVCARVEYDRMNYARPTVYIHEPVEGGA